MKRSLQLVALIVSASFCLQASATITVTTTNDSGAGSLRQAIIDSLQTDTINFDSSLNGQTITLTSGQLLIDKDLTITGPGANLLTINGNAASRIFYISLTRTVTISGLTIMNGFEVDSLGGGIFNDRATLTMSNCTLSGNSASLGGGVFNDHATLTMSNCTLSGNSGESLNSGGGIYNQGSFVDAQGGAPPALLIVTNSTISGNSAGNSGGSIYNNGANFGKATLAITNSTLSGNSAGYYGGGIYNDSANFGRATLTITNSTLSGNSAFNYGGGGIYNHGRFPGTDGGQAQVTITNSTVSGNSANAGGGIYNDAATVTIGQTILNAGSGANIVNDQGTVTSLGYNLSSDDASAFLNGTGDQNSSTPLLGPLQNNGGSTFTHALLTGSPAIDAGSLQYDQRGPGYLRVVNGILDIGAFEVQAPSPSPTPTVPPSPSPTATATATATATPTPTSTGTPGHTPRPRPTHPPHP